MKQEYTYDTTADISTVSLLGAMQDEIEKLEKKHTAARKENEKLRTDLEETKAALALAAQEKEASDLAHEQLLEDLNDSCSRMIRERKELLAQQQHVEDIISAATETAKNQVNVRAKEQLQQYKKQLLSAFRNKEDKLLTLMLIFAAMTTVLLLVASIQSPFVTHVATFGKQLYHILIGWFSLCSRFASALARGTSSAGFVWIIHCVVHYLLPIAGIIGVVLLIYLFAKKIREKYIDYATLVFQ